MRSDDGQTLSDRRTERISTCRLNLCKGSSKNLQYLRQTLVTKDGENLFIITTSQEEWGKTVHQKNAPKDKHSREKTLVFGKHTRSISECRVGRSKIFCENIENGEYKSDSEVIQALT